VRAGGGRPWSNDGTLCGVYYGIVCQNKDDDKKLGRIKVRFPWLDEGDKDQAWWAQLAVPMVGNKFGWWIIPEIEDVVVVVFVAGDVAQPVVIGGIWSKTDTPPEPITDGKDEFRGYRSRCGHRFLLEDTKKGKISFRDKSNKCQLHIGEFAKDGQGPNPCEAAKPSSAGEKGVASASADGTYKILCPDGKLTITGKKIEILGDSQLDVKSGGDLTLKGQTIEFGSAQAGKYEGSKTKLG